MPRYAITDIHGCARTFAAMLDRLGVGPGDELYLLGDYVDRGPDSKGVVDRIWEAEAAGVHVRCLRGNHEQMLLDALTDPLRLHHFQKYGGKETLASFGVAHPNKIPSRYLKFFAQLDYYIDLPGEYLFVHAGINFEHTVPLADRHAMLYLRPWQMNLDRDWLDGRVLVHGHTPTPKEEIEESLAKLGEKPVLNLDAGCVYERLGYLCAFDLDARSLTFSERKE